MQVENENVVRRGDATSGELHLLKSRRALHARISLDVPEDIDASAELRAAYSKYDASESQADDLRAQLDALSLKDSTDAQALDALNRRFCHLTTVVRYVELRTVRLSLVLTSWLFPRFSNRHRTSSKAQLVRMTIKKTTPTLLRPKRHLLEQILGLTRYQYHQIRSRVVWCSVGISLFPLVSPFLLNSDFLGLFNVLCDCVQ